MDIFGLNGAKWVATARFWCRGFSPSIGDNIHSLDTGVGAERPTAQKRCRGYPLDVRRPALTRLLFVAKKMAMHLPSCINTRQDACRKRSYRHKYDENSQRPIRTAASQSRIRHFPYQNGNAVETCCRKAGGQEPNNEGRYYLRYQACDALGFHEGTSLTPPARYTRPSSYANVVTLGSRPHR
jgi:hypothetical protein